MKESAKEARFISLSKRITNIFHEIQSVRTYDVILRVMFQNEKKITFEVSELNLGKDIDFPIVYEVVPPLYFNVGLTSDSYVNPTLDWRGITSELME